MGDFLQIDASNSGIVRPGGLIQRIGFREKIPKTPMFHRKIDGFRWRFSPNPWMLNMKLVFFHTRKHSMIHFSPSLWKSVKEPLQNSDEPTHQVDQSSLPEFETLQGGAPMIKSIYNPHDVSKTQVIGVMFANLANDPCSTLYQPLLRGSRPHRHWPRGDFFKSRIYKGIIGGSKTIFLVTGNLVYVMYW